MSVHLADSALSRFNAAGAHEPVLLPEELVRVLRSAERMASATDGAFDATCRPVIELWRDAGKTDRKPQAEQIAAALRRVGTRHLALGDGVATKRVEGLELDLGGIAKGYAVDRAADLLQSCPGAGGGIVNAGGDLRCFGRNPRGRAWKVGVQHPFREGLCGTLSLTDAAVATSGDYRRYVEIGGRRYSHIVDPRTGRPVEHAHSVTVVSMGALGRRPSATDADGWATALSVLGPEGLGRIEAEPGLEAMIVTGTPARPEVHMTARFRMLLQGDIRLD
jgi:thiamine biosynthesis lipoprotein